MDIAIDSRWVYYPEKNRLIENGRIIIENNKIIYSGPIDTNNSNSNIAGHERFTFEKGITLPGFINGHTHLPETLLRGICDDQTLQTWLYDYIWKVEPQMTPENAYWGSMLGIAEMLSSGTVGFNDQYFYADKIAEAVSETGIKAMLSPSIFFNGNPEADSMEEAFKNAKNAFKKWNGNNERIWIGFGPHAPYTVDKDWFLKITSEARKLNTTIHTHLNETKEEVNNALKNWNMRPIEWVNDMGIFDVVKSAAHCIWLSDHELEILKSNNISILHCPKSNAKIGAGIADIPNAIEKGVNVTLGTDGQASNNKLDMIEEMAFTALIHKAIKGNPTVMPTHEVIKMATTNGSNLFPKNIYAGTLEENTTADITVIDLDTVNTTPIINPVSHLIYAINKENVAMTIVDGEILYLHGNLLLMNIQEVKDKSQKATMEMIAKSESTNK